MITGITKHLHGCYNNFRGLALVAITVFPIPGAESSLDVDLFSLLEILTTDFSQFTENYDAMPFGPFGLLAVLVGKISAGSHVKIGYS